MSLELVIKKRLPQHVIKAAQKAKTAIEEGFLVARKMNHGHFSVVNLPSFYRAVLLDGKMFCMSHEDYNKICRTKCH